MCDVVSATEQWARYARNLEREFLTNSFRLSVNVLETCTMAAHTLGPQWTSICNFPTCRTTWLKFGLVDPHASSVRTGTLNTEPHFVAETKCHLPVYVRRCTSTELGKLEGYRNLVILCEFPENLRREGSTAVMSQNKSTLMHVPYTGVRNFDSKERLTPPALLFRTEQPAVWMTSQLTGTHLWIPWCLRTGCWRLRSGEYISCGTGLARTRPSLLL